MQKRSRDVVVRAGGIRPRPTARARQATLARQAADASRGATGSRPGLPPSGASSDSRHSNWTSSTRLNGGDGNSILQQLSQNLSVAPADSSGGGAPCNLSHELRHVVPTGERPAAASVVPPAPQPAPRQAPTVPHGVLTNFAKKFDVDPDGILGSQKRAAPEHGGGDDQKRPRAGDAAAADSPAPQNGLSWLAAQLPPTQGTQAGTQGGTQMLPLTQEQMVVFAPQSSVGQATAKRRQQSAAARKQRLQEARKVCSCLQFFSTSRVYAVLFVCTCFVCAAHVQTSHRVPSPVMHDLTPM